MTPPRNRLALLVAALLLLPAAALKADPSRESAWLQRYLQFDTANPPGHEKAALEWLSTLLALESVDSVESEILISPGGRASLIARLRANDASYSSGASDAGKAGKTPGRPRVSPRPALLLLHHVDVVPAGDNGSWQHPPFAGTEADGALWGRGSIDCKSLGIAHLGAFLAAARSSGRQRDLIFLATADEESGGLEGLGWLLDQRPELLAGVEAVLTEGGTGKSVAGRPLWWGIEVEQKRPLWLRLSARGREGHGSNADSASAAHRLILGLAKLLETPPPIRGSAAALSFLQAVGRFDPRAARAARETERLLQGESLDRLDLKALAGFENLLRDSLQVTTLRGSERINIVPGEASAELDIRLLPETDAEQFLTELRHRLGDELEVRVELAPVAPGRSPTANPTYRLIAERLGEEAPVVPAFLPAFTDARYFRARGIPAYGVSPFALDARELRTVHAVDERISITEFDRGVARMQRLVLDLLSAPRSR